MNGKWNPGLARLVIPLLVGVLVLLAVLVLLSRAFGEGDVHVLKRAPAFALKDTDGHAVKLADFTDKALIICFVVTWDEPSLKQIAILSDVLKEHNDKELAVLAMAVEQAESQSTKSYVEQQHPSFPFLVVDYKTIQAFGGLNAVPTTFVINKGHNIIQRHIGITEKKVLEDELKTVLQP
jgi:peroxiredoxin